MIPRFKPTLGFSELLAALRPPRKDDVERFEQSFAKLMGQKYALAFPYGRTGLMLLLEALELKDKEIICPAYTCVVVPHAIVFSGNVPVFVDCKEGEFNMDLDLAERAITKKTGAVVATSLFGYPVDMDRLHEICERHPHVYVIQDCAHSFAAEWNGRQVQEEGIAAFFGFNISKTLTSVFGGMVTTDNEEIHKKLKTIREKKLEKANWQKGFRRLLYLVGVYFTFWGPLYGLVNRLERSSLLNYFVQYYDESKIDMPEDYTLEMSRLEARVGLENVKSYHQIIDRRRAAAHHYFASLTDKSDSWQHRVPQENTFILPPKIDGSTYSHFVIQVSDRAKLLKSCIQTGIQLGWLIEYNIPEMKSYGARPPEEFPIAARYARRAINLPVWGGAKLAEKVSNAISNCVRKTPCLEK
jgi:dTDP-4-amino-4,6-dideoxygalactose transaminase